MQSVIVILALIILFIYIYGYALSFYDKHRSENKILYIPIYKKSSDNSNIPDSNIPDSNVPDSNVPDSNVPDSNVPDSNVPDLNVPDSNVPNSNVSDDFVIQHKDENTCDPNKQFDPNGDNDLFCLNGGVCINVSGTDGNNYNNCKCKIPFAGENCEKNIGVQVLIHDNFTSPTVIKRIPMFEYKGQDYFIQDNDYL